MEIGYIYHKTRSPDTFGMHYISAPWLSEDTIRGLFTLESQSYKK